MLGFTSDSPQLSASPQQLDFAPYASGSYNAQWNAPGLLHDKHMLRLSRILGEMEVEEPWLGLWLPLNYRVESKLAYDIGIGVNSIGFFAAKFLPWLVFWFVIRVVFGIGCAVGGPCG